MPPETDTKIHYFSKPVSHIGLPSKFTYPFHYTPHPLCIMAVKEVQDYLVTQKQWQKELEQGKMFGVLIVQNPENRIGYLAAFSGILAGKNIHTFFVPPVYDVQQPEGFFRIEEEQITAINDRIKALEKDKNYLKNKHKLAEINREAQQILADTRKKLKASKAVRALQRQEPLTEAAQAVLIRESQFQKAEYNRLKHRWQNQINELQAGIEAYETVIADLKNKRKNRSATLQQKLFEQFRMLNYRGEVKNLCEIFKYTAQATPPAGAGECAAPKLLQYAFLNHLYPLAMAEFWWGNSPKTEIRHQGHYYPACSGKCGPILEFMLQGLDIETNPLLYSTHQNIIPEILFEDEWLLVINKPTGMLSVPGKSDVLSVYEQLKNRYPEATGPLIVHRLDMATSGLLLVAKTKEVHQHLQAQFKNHNVKKRYIALLDGIPTTNEGIIDLPLCPDPMDRPRQIVNYEYGKPAITRYQVLECHHHQALVAFFPLTGRTHQLRVHAAHPLGLNTPILGDELYGHKAQRLYLHAQQIEFKHPINNKVICIEKDADF